ncbi:hypothetical protein FLONG3_2099 [Fusarium longipes]|uniref:Uncharacterized protein n=1 Tax=Fusarium longipes TaxID=694270 RepID=A0A395T5P6_9HYPO|nr:hypothetical protein FLONG3_2099 [Fusarium longipes]
MYRKSDPKAGPEPSYQPVDIQNTNEQRKPSFFSGTPWLGIAGIIITIVSAVGIIVALYSANERAVDSWPSEDTPIQLTVLLAILIALANIGLRIAHKEGTTLTWWVEMSKGATLAESHRIWEHGGSAWSSTVGFLHLHITKIGVVSILMAFLSANGPLVQRAASITTGTSSESATFTANLSPDMFLNNTGYYQTRASVVTALSTSFRGVVLPFTNREPIKLNLKGCDGLCTGTLIGPGFDYNCTQRKQKYKVGFSYGRAGTTWEIGSIQIQELDKFSPDVINVTTAYKGDAAAVGNLTVTNCILHLATVQYPFVYTNGTLELQGLGTSVGGLVNRTEELLYLPREQSALGTWPSRLGGFAYALSRIYDSKVELYNTGSLALIGEGPMAYTYMSSNDSALDGQSESMTWSDPTPSILDAFHEMGFRTALAYSNSSTEQTIQGTQERTFIKYTINANFLAGSLAVTFASVLAVMLLYYGFWVIGRPATMSPLETAHAFQSPATSGEDMLKKADDLAKAFENRKVKYDVIQGKIIMVDGEMVDNEDLEASTGTQSVNGERNDVPNIDEERNNGQEASIHTTSIDQERSSVQHMSGHQERASDQEASVGVPIMGERNSGDQQR